MIKYYEILDDRANYYLPLVDNSVSDTCTIRNFKLPLSFFIKYKDLFEYSKKIINEIQLLNSESIFRKYYHEDYSKACDLLSSIYSFKEELDEINSLMTICSSSRDYYNYFGFCKRVLHFLGYIYPENVEQYNYQSKLFSDALKEMKEIGSIKFKADNNVNLVLPDAWFINSFGHLYNTGGYNGHKEANLIYPYRYRIKDCIKDDVSIDGLYQYCVDKKKEIEGNGFIKRTDFSSYLNYRFGFVSLDENVPYFSQTSHNRRIFETVVGIVEAQIGLYSFFSNLQKYTDNPKNELEKIINLTSDDISDILVRCCGFHKIESTVEKTITTSCLNYEYQFSEYIKRGWNISFIPPIIINRELKEIQELNMDSYFVKKVLQKNNRI